MTEFLITVTLPTDEIQEDTQLMLTNAIYFKDAWKVAFNQLETDQVSGDIIIALSDNAID